MKDQIWLALNKTKTREELVKHSQWISNWKWKNFILKSIKWQKWEYQIETMIETIKEELMRKKGNNFKTKLNGKFKNFLVMNNFYAINISPRYKKHGLLSCFFREEFKNMFFFLPLLARAKLKGKY